MVAEYVSTLDYQWYVCVCVCDVASLIMCVGAVAIVMHSQLVGKMGFFTKCVDP